MPCKVGLKAPIGTHLRLAFFVGRMQLTPKNYHWVETDQVHEEEVCLLENEITGDECTVGVAILSNLNETPEEVLLTKEAGKFICDWEIENAKEKADRHPRGCGLTK